MCSRSESAQKCSTTLVIAQKYMWNLHINISLRDLSNIFCICWTGSVISNLSSISTTTADIQCAVDEENVSS